MFNIMLFFSQIIEFTFLMHLFIFSISINLTFSERETFLFIKNVKQNKKHLDRRKFNKKFATVTATLGMS